MKPFTVRPRPALRSALAVALGVGALATSAGGAAPAADQRAAGTKAAPAAPPGAAAPAAGVAARVNGVAIPADRVEHELQGILAEAKSQGAGAPPASLRQDIVDRFITTELIYQEAARNKVVPTAEEVKAEMDRVRAQFPDPKQLDQALREEGMKPESFQEEVRKDLAVRAWIKKNVEDAVTVADAEAKTYYDAHPEEFKKPESVVASHILIRAKADAPAEEKAAARKKAEAARARVTKGEDFAAVAKELSEDPGSAPSGGDLGSVPRGQTVPAFEEAAFALAAGKVSEVVETQFGYHVIRVGEKSPAGVLPLDEIKEQLKQFLLMRARRDRLKEVVSGLRSKAKVEVL